MNRRTWGIAFLVVVALSALIAVSLTADRAGSAASQEASSTPAEFLSTDFSACDTGSASNPAPVSIAATDFSGLLGGVWVGTRTARDAPADMANYVLIFDTTAREGLAFEERGPGITENAFERLLPPPPPGAPSITYFYCGGSEFGAFRDVFVKVSDQPGDGLRALRDHTGVALSESSVFGAWSELRAVDYFRRPITSALRNTSFYTLSIVDSDVSGSTETGVRWDMVGQYRGSPAKFVHGQPIAGLEGGYFQGTSSAEGIYAAGQEVAILCFCDPTAVDWENGTPLTNFNYTKVIIGPLS